ncbi:hypothetical protein A2G06_16945 (plasmid) [Geobacter anodireducens]|nr:hypothetical protein A2G06_16945 [Geobacter anodireducens]
MRKEFILNIHDNSECQVPGADKAIVTIFDQLRFRILQMAGMVRALCIFNSAELDDTPRFMVENWDAKPNLDGSQPLKPYPGKMNDMRLVVTAHVFYWEGSYRNDYRWTTDSIPLSELDGYDSLETVKIDAGKGRGSYELLQELIEAFPQADPESDIFDEGINGCEAVNFLTGFIPRVREHFDCRMAR